jgi:hypothetical protein
MMNVEDWPQFAALRQEVDEELESTIWGANATHGTPYLYGRGCRGPLCKKANLQRKYKPGQREPLEWGYFSIREAEYLEEKRLKKVAEYMRTRPPGTTREDWIERAMKIGRQEQAS